MNNVNKFYFTVFIVGFLICFSTVIPVVNADSVFLASNFDDVPAGVDECNTGLFLMDNIGTANYFETSTTEDCSAPNSLKCYQVAGAGLNGWLNFTVSFSYITRFNFTVHSVADHGAGDSTLMDFYDGDDVVIRINFTGDDGTWWYTDAGWNKVTANAFGANYDLIFNITHLYTNFFNVNMTGTVTGDEDLSIGVTSSWNGFDAIHIYSNTGTCSLYFDDFYIETDVDESGYNCCYGDTFTVCKNFVNSTVGYGETVEFLWWRIPSDLIRTVFYVIVDFDGNYIDYGYFYGNDGRVFYTPSEDDGVGTFYFRIKFLTSDSFDVSCPFTVVSTDTVNPTLSNWTIYVDSHSVEPDTNFRVYYNVSSVTGTLVVVKDGSWYDTWSVSGIGNFYWNSGVEDTVWKFQLWDSNSVFKNETFVEVKDVSNFWNVKVNGKYIDSVNAETEFTMSYDIEGFRDTVYIGIYNSSNMVEDNLKYRRYIGNGDKSGVFNDVVIANYSVGMETFYYSLCYRNGTGFSDGVRRIIYVYDSDDTDMDNTTEDYEDRTLDEWQFAIGVFCIFGGFLATAVGTNKMGLNNGSLQTVVSCVGGMVGLAFALYYGLIDVVIGFLIGLLLIIVLVLMVNRMR